MGNKFTAKRNPCKMVNQTPTTLSMDYIEELMHAIKINSAFKCGIREILQYNNKYTHLAFAMVCMSYLPVDHKLRTMLNKFINTTNFINNDNMNMFMSIKDSIYVIVRLSKTYYVGYYNKTLSIINYHIDCYEDCYSQTSV